MEYIKHYTFDDNTALSNINTFLVSKENYIKETYSFLGDFGTGLKENHVSTRSGGYNIFNMVDECSDLSKLLNFIIESYVDYLNNVLPNKTFENNEINPAIMCWLNILRESEKIGMHKHAEDYGELWSFISGTFVLNASETNTYYYNDKKTTNVSNVNGRLTLFPPFYLHWTDIQSDNSIRSTLGLDILFNRNNASGDSTFEQNLVSINI